MFVVHMSIWDVLRLAVIFVPLLLLGALLLPGVVRERWRRWRGRK